MGVRLGDFGDGQGVSVKGEGGNYVVAIPHVDDGEGGGFGADELGEFFAGDAGEGGDGVGGHCVVCSCMSEDCDRVRMVWRRQELIELRETM